MKTFETPNSSFTQQSKDNHFIAQFNKVYSGFYKQPQSMMMLSVKLDIDRSNICWYCRKFRKNDSIGIAKRSICTITKKVVNYYTTNPELYQTTNQLKLF